MPPWRRSVLAAVLALSPSTALTCGGAEAEPKEGVGADEAGPPSEAEPPPGKAADGTVFGLDGEPLDPLASTEARATVLVFVSTHCPIANRYAPTLRRLAEGWRSEGVEAWLVYPDPDDDAAAIREHQAAFSLALPTVRDPQHRLVARAQARVTPEAAVFVPGRATPAYHGRIDDRAVEFGKVRAEATTHDLRDAVAAVLEGSSPAPAGGPAIGCYISDLR